MTVDVIILTYKPDNKFLKAIEALKSQTVKPGKIIIINTEKQYFEELIPEDEFLDKNDTGVIFHIGTNEFDHGKTRNFAVSHVNSDSFIMMTQDAVPADNYLIENLINAIKDEKNIAVSYARQLPTGENDELENFIRGFNYGPVPIDKTKTDIEQLGIKAYFCSNVCAIYNMNIFRQLGGFVDKTIFNEDMIYAKKALDTGYVIRYEPEAIVYHAHNYTYRQQLKRNFDLGVSHAEYPEVFYGLAAESEGLKMIKSAILHLLKKGKPWLIVKLFCQSLAKYRGFRLGLRFHGLKKKQVLKYTNNLIYWR
ncbi:MAG: glycosyltransferase [Lachnospiraceae bacterium]|nr:glycosyltransferase [Lachnospiraceae bacterium]